jgi:intein-encoded DNA endonuclease-like protein
VLYFFGKCPVTWISHKQKIVAQSSCEAEYVAAACASSQGIWLGRLLGEILGHKAERSVLKIDNQSAISLCKNPVFHDRTKHIDVRYHVVRNYVEEGKIAVEHVRTEEQLADILTKPLARFRFQALKEKIGIQEISSDIKLKGVKC